MFFSFFIFRFILTRMLFLVTMKLHPLLMDQNLNGSEGVLKNIFEINFVSALRLHSIIDSMIFQPKLNLSDFPKG
jgi:hypothetical protein